MIQEALGTANLAQFHQLLRAALHDLVNQLLVAAAMQFFPLPVDPRKPLHDMKQDLLLPGHVPERLDPAVILLAQNIQRGKFPAAVFCADLAGHILVRGIQIKDKPYLRRKVGAEFFRFRLLDIHNFLQLGQDPVVKFCHMVPSHMKRKSFITRQTGQGFNLFLEILFHPAELSVTDIISRIGPHIQLRQAAVHPDSVKYSAASHLFLGNTHGNIGIAFRAG